MKKYFSILIFVFGAIATVFLALNSFKSGDAELSGFVLAFGGKVESLDLGIFSIDAKHVFNPVIAFALFLPLVAGIFGFLKSKASSLVSAVLFVVAIILILTISSSQVLIITPIIENTIPISLELTKLGTVSVVSLGVGLLCTLFKLVNN